MVASETFSFGANWQSLINRADESRVHAAVADIEAWLGTERVRGQRVLDVGSGSGLHSLAFGLLQARQVVSFDIDADSVEATQKVRQRYGGNFDWQIMRGSALDSCFLEPLGQFGIVYAWGVLHHTGDMWRALRLVGDRVKPGGLWWLALYAKGPRYEQHLALKRRYNRASALGRRLLTGRAIAKEMCWRALHGRNPLSWNKPRARGMDRYHDIIDWLGGLPYEVVAVEEVLGFAEERGFTVVNLKEAHEGANHVFLLHKSCS